MRKILTGAAAVLAAAGVRLVLRRRARMRAVADAATARAGRRLRYAQGLAVGARYRMSGRHPDPNVDDRTLADRIRATLGPLERRLDVPRVHVLVADRVAVLHGSVDAAEQALEIERAVRAVPGVRGVESHLHAGLVAGDTRPSDGRTRTPSRAFRRLLEAAADAGAADARDALRATLVGLADRLPAAEWEHVVSHLPRDVRTLVSGPRRFGTAARIRSVPDFVAAVRAESAGLDREVAESVIRSVFAALHELVPEEVADVAAVLPAELRPLWHPVGVG